MTVHRLVIHLEVPRMDNLTNGRVHDEGSTVRNAVVYPNRFNSERTDLDRIVKQHLAQVNVSRTIVPIAVCKSLSNKGQGKRRTVDGNIDVTEQIWKGAYMVIVSVCEDNPLQPISVIQNISKIGQNKINTRVVSLGNFETGIHNDHVVTMLEHRTIHPEGTDTAEGDDP
jgi:hypothetical protein